MQWRGVSILQEKWCRASWASRETVERATLGAWPAWLHRRGPPVPLPFKPKSHPPPSGSVILKPVNQKMVGE